MKIILTAIFLVVLLPRIASQTLTTGNPAEAGFSAERLTRIDNMMNDAIAKKWLPGISALIVRNGRIVFHKAYGYSDLDKKTPLKKDDMYRIASQTKAITSTAVMMLYEEGKIQLDAPVSKYIPEFSNPTVLTSFNPKDSSYTTTPAKSEITIRQLLIHTSGLDYATIGSDEFKAIYAKAGITAGLEKPMEKLGPKIRKLGKLPLKFNPGEQWYYSLGPDVLGYVVEVTSGMTLDEFFRKRIFGPLTMDDTYFYVPKEKQGRLVTVYSEQKDGSFRKMDAAAGLTPDYPLAPGTYYSGGGGLTSTLEDYAKFLQMFLNGGHYNGVRLLSRKTIEMMMTNQTGDLQMQFGLGFKLETAKNDHESPVSLGSFGWGGVFSTMYWGDPKEKVIGLVYKQLLPTSHGDIDDVFQAMVYAAITD